MTTTPLPRTLELLEQGIAAGHHLGGQLYVSRAGETLADLAFGEARPGEPMRREHLLLWLSSSKPLTAVALARFWERGRLSVDDPVARHVPEFAAHGKEGITLRHLLTHTAGIRMLGVGWPRTPWDGIIAKICDRRAEPRWEPGRRAGYHRESSWFVLGEVIQRLAGRPFAEHLRETLLQPLGMVDSWIGMPAERWRAYGARIAPSWDTSGAHPEERELHDEAHVTHPSPAGSGRGPMRELGRFYEALLAGGELAGERVLAEPTVAALTARHRVGMVDRTFDTPLDWGLGFILDSKHYHAGSRTGRPPYGYGPHAGPRTFGHAGYRSSIAFCDPDARLVVALGVNGMPEDGVHLERFDRVLGGLYGELGLAGDAG